MCEKSEGETRLEIDHIDGNPANHDPMNLRLLCHSCNIKTALERSHKITSEHHGVFVEREGENLSATAKIKAKLDYQRGSLEMQANDYFELSFRNYITAKIKQKGEIEKEDAIGSGAEVSGASVNACRNYLIKMTSSEGPCIEIKLPSKTRVIRLKPEYLEAS